MDIKAFLEFFNSNALFILVPILFALLMFLKPFRIFIAYCVKNTVNLIFFGFISFLCSVFGYTLSFNIFSVAAALLLGLPGISLALFLSLLI